MTHEIFVCAQLSSASRKNPKIISSLKSSLHKLFSSFGDLRCPVVATRAGAYVIAIVRYEQAEIIDQVLQKEQQSLILDIKDANIVKVLRAEVRKRTRQFCTIFFKKKFEKKLALQRCLRG